MKYEKEMQELEDETLLVLYKKIQEHIQYLKSSIIIAGEEDGSDE